MKGRLSEGERLSRMKIKKGSSCHYCKRSATTRDHIVPKSIVLGIYNPRVTNFVAACDYCNKKKANKRSNCVCEICSMAWRLYGPIDMEIEIIDMLGVGEVSLP